MQSEHVAHMPDRDVRDARDARPVFRVLGPQEVEVATDLVHVGGPQIRGLLALLLIRPGQVISLSALVANLWRGEAPVSAHTTARTYVSRLRHALAPIGSSRTGGPLIETKPPGYLLRIDAASVDATLFDQLSASGRQAAAREDVFTAREHFIDALALWRGDAYGEFADVPMLRREAIRLEELRLGTVENRVQMDLNIGLGPELVAEIDGLVTANPLRERLWVQYMTALYRSGRQAEALSTYLRARTYLLDELGLEPSVELVDTHRRILDQDPLLLQGVRQLTAVRVPRVGEDYRAATSGSQGSADDRAGAGDPRPASDRQPPAGVGAGGAEPTGGGWCNRPRCRVRLRRVRNAVVRQLAALAHWLDQFATAYSARLEK